jgi:hypothetical protein
MTGDRRNGCGRGGPGDRRAASDGLVEGGAAFGGPSRSEARTGRPGRGQSPTPWWQFFLHPVAAVLAFFAFSVTHAEEHANLRFQSGLPGMRVPMTVDRVVERGPYLEAHLLLEKKPIQAYTAPSPECREVFLAGEGVTFIDNGPRGVYRRGETDCQSLGFGNLVVWRDRSQRSTRANTPIPRALASFQIIFEDSEVYYLHGSFPLAGRLRFSNPADVVAIVPKDDQCTAAVKDGASSMEYREKGKVAYSLSGKSGPCIIQGFASPIHDVASGGEAMGR